MTNLEKYPNTADAVKAWNEYNSGRDESIGFKDWLNLDYIDSRSLLNVAKRIRRWIEEEVFLGPSGISVLKDLKAEIASEEARPKRNFERFATAKEAFDAFRKACRVQLCEACHLKNKIMARTGGYVPCTVRWLYLSDPNLDRAKEESEETGKLEDRK